MKMNGKGMSAGKSKVVATKNLPGAVGGAASGGMRKGGAGMPSVMSANHCKAK